MPGRGKHANGVAQVTSLGSEVKRLREGVGLSQAELAKSSHLGLKFIWGIEHDEDVEFGEWHLERLAATLGVSVGRLILLLPHHRRKQISRSGGAC